MIQRYVTNPLQCAITHHSVTDFTVDGMVNDTKHWISRERSITFPWNKKILQLYVRDYIFWNYIF